MNPKSSKVRGIMRSYRLAPALIARIRNAAEWTGISDTSLVEIAITEYVRKIEIRQQKEILLSQVKEIES
jgi:hypothetical protein